MYFLESFVNIKDGGEEKVVYVKEDSFVALLRGKAEEAELSSFLYSILDELDDNLSLSEFDELIASKIREKNLPPSIDLACGFLKNGTLYLKTINKGEIFGKRGKERGRIIFGNKSAAGKVKKGDLYLFTFEGFKKEALEELNKSYFSSEAEREEIPQPFIASFITEIEKEKETFMPTYDEGLDGKKELSKVFNKRLLQYGVVGIVILILFFSVYSGYKKRQEKIAREKVAKVSAKVEELLSKAEEEAFFSPAKAKEYFEKAKEQVESLEEELPKGKKDLANDLKKELEEKQQAIFKESSKKLEEIFDLQLIGKNLKGKELAFSKDTAFVLTEKGKTAFVNIKTKESGEVGTEGLGGVINLASFDGKGYVFSKKGIFELKEGEKPELLVEPSEEWGKIVDFEVYGKNFYLLDSSKNQVLKHTPLEGGYSDAIEYLKGSLPSIDSSADMAIDGSIYIASGEKVYKYYQGRRQKFSLKIPEENFKADLLYTDKDLDFLYLLDKKAGKVYVVDKESGELEEQIQNKALSRANGLFVYNGNIYILVGDKIYSLR